MQVGEKAWRWGISASVGLGGLGLIALGMLEVPNPGMPTSPALATAPPVGSQPVILAEQQAAASSPAPPLRLAVAGLASPPAAEASSAPSTDRSTSKVPTRPVGTPLQSPGGITLSRAPSTPVTVTVPATPVTPPVTVPVTLPSLPVAGGSPAGAGTASSTPSSPAVARSSVSGTSSSAQLGNPGSSALPADVIPAPVTTVVNNLAQLLVPLLGP